MLEVGMGDEDAAGLFARFLRGDRTVTGQLYQRLTISRGN